MFSTNKLSPSAKESSPSKLKNKLKNKPKNDPIPKPTPWQFHIIKRTKEKTSTLRLTFSTVFILLPTIIAALDCFEYSSSLLLKDCDEKNKHNPLTPSILNIISSLVLGLTWICILKDLHTLAQENTSDADDFFLNHDQLKSYQSSMKKAIAANLENSQITKLSIKQKNQITDYLSYRITIGDDNKTKPITTILGAPKPWFEKYQTQLLIAAAVIIAALYSSPFYLPLFSLSRNTSGSLGLTITIISMLLYVGISIYGLYSNQLATTMRQIGRLKNMDWAEYCAKKILSTRPNIDLEANQPSDFFKYKALALFANSYTDSEQKMISAFENAKSSIEELQHFLPQETNVSLFKEPVELLSIDHTDTLTNLKSFLNEHKAEQSQIEGIVTIAESNLEKLIDSIVQFDTIAKITSNKIAR